MSSIKNIYDKYKDIQYHVIGNYDEIKSTIDNPLERLFFQIYVDLFITLQRRKPTLLEFSNKIQEIITPNIEVIYNKYTTIQYDVIGNYEGIKSTIDNPLESLFFQIYVDLFISLQRKPTLDEFRNKIIELVFRSKGGKRRRLKRSKRLRKNKRLRKRRTMRRRK